VSRRFPALLLACSATAAAAAVAPASPSSSFDKAAADAVAGAVLAAGPSAGLAIGVSRGGTVLFVRGYGLANSKDRVAVGPNTVFPICSISKNFAAAAVLKLAEEGRVDRSAPASSYLSEVPGLSADVTVDRLLNHSSGLGSYNEGDDWDAVQARALPHAEIVARIASRPRTPAGREWHYSNSAFYLAGLIVERVSGKGYWDYLADAFFRPLGMRRAGPCAGVPPTARARGYRATGARLVGAEQENWNNPFAAGGLCMTAGELLRWEAALDAGRLLSGESLRAMRTPTRLADGRRYDYGLGTRLGSLEGHRAIGHTGGGQGFSTVLLRFPDDDLTIVVLENSASGPGAATIAARLARRLLGLPEFAPRPGTPPAAILAALSGDWTGDDGPFRLGAREGRLVVELPGRPEPIESPWMGGAAFAAGEEVIGRFVVSHGRSDRGSVYGGGLFESVIVRRTDGASHSISDH
jgi:D-alanyl-D-alanine carboxypeptidase